MQNTAPPTLVTASTDRVDLLTYPLYPDRDLRLCGMVTYVGSSSMNIAVDLLTVPTQPGETPKPVMMANQTFVARGAGNRAIPVPRLVPRSPFEKQLHEQGRAESEARRLARSASLHRTPPTPEELAIVHNLFMEQTALARRGRSGSMEFVAGTTAPPLAPGAPRAKPMYVTDTCLSTTFVTQPDMRNIHGKVFGGWLMRVAFETAWACAWSATGTTPKFLALDDITFLQPVEFGKLLRLDAQIDYCKGPPHKTYSVSVAATMHTPGDVDAGRDMQLTNEFNFTFYADDAGRLPRVYPRSYADAMSYIHAFRRQRAGQAAADQRKREGGPQPRFDGSMGA